MVRRYGKYILKRGFIMFRERIRRFMMGRYGFDSYSKFLIIAAIVCLMLSSFNQRHFIGVVFYFAGWIMTIYSFYRTLSRDTYKRAAENQQYLAKSAGIRSKFKNLPNDMEQRKMYHIYKCPKCKQKIRIPRGKGRIEISCPKCGEKFIKNS